jgi:hypothetical protein
MRNLIIVLFFILTCCSFNSRNQKNINDKPGYTINGDTSNNMDSDRRPIIGSKNIKHLYSLKMSDGSLLGDVYVGFINQYVFSDLIILGDSGGKADTLYQIEKEKFFNSKGLDISVSKENLIGYRFVLRKENYFTLTCVDIDGKDASDYITIEWNYEDKVFEVQKAP